jgi:hypothetical protein
LPSYPFRPDVAPPDVTQHPFAQDIGIALPSLGKGNDLVGDSLLDIVGAVTDPQSDADEFEGNTEHTRSLGIEVLTVEEWSDLHSSPSPDA